MRSRLRLTGTFYIAAILAFAVAIPTGPATAQGLFDFLFNAFRRPSTPPNSYADPNSRGPRVDKPTRRSRSGGDDTTRTTRESRGGGLAYCVRLCDGRYFPINYRRGSAADEVCNALCPATNTKVFSGSNIEAAVAADGKSYTELPAAFAYRSSVAEDCSCNGKDPFGLAQIETEDDPTLKSGDIVATPQGFMVADRKEQRLGFTPLRGQMRSKLLATKIVPNRTREAGTVTIRAGTGEALDQKETEVKNQVGGQPHISNRAGEATTDGKAPRNGP